MAKGKQATLALRRQLAGAMEHLSAVTDELAELKVRTRDAEARAFHAEQRAKNAERQVQNDAAFIRQCRDLIDLHRKLNRERMAEWNDGAKEDFGKMLCDIPMPFPMGPSDIIEWLSRRYPRLFKFLGREEVLHTHRGKHMKGLTEEHVRQLGRAMGERVTLSWDPDRDAADVFNDLLDVRTMNLTQEEMAELLDLDKAKK